MMTVLIDAFVACVKAGFERKNIVLVQNCALGFIYCCHVKQKKLSLREGTETLCHDDIGGIFLEAPIISDLRENADEIG